MNQTYYQKAQLPSGQVHAGVDTCIGTTIDESPQAYKDVDQIIESVVGAGLAQVVAKCKPLATVKGT